MAFKKLNGNKKDDFKVEIIEDYGILSENEKGYQMKLTYASWNGNDPKYDIRPWKDGRGYKGITLTGEELENLYNLLKEIAEKE